MFDNYIGRLVRITWQTGHVSVCKIVETNDTHVMTSDYLKCNVFTRPNWKHKNHVRDVSPVILH